MYLNFFFLYFFVFSKSIVTIIDTIQFFPKDKTYLGFSRVKPCATKQLRRPAGSSLETTTSGGTSWTF